jgi:phage head maturation protease
MVGSVRFSRRSDVEDIWQDVRDGIVRWVSVGYRVHKFEEDASSADKIPTRTAIDWEPFEASLVAMPADIGARVRSGDKTHTNECVVVTRINEDAGSMSRFRQLALGRAS